MSAPMKAGGGGFPKMDPAAKALFEAIVPERPGVEVRPMFGHLAGFVHGNMFVGLFGPHVFVRLGPEEREELMAEAGTALFEPMPGRAMKEYVVMPTGWRSQPEHARSWAARSYEWAARLPPKSKSKPKAIHPKPKRSR
jgi:TfoX/Sxy family transcriptional regulator of competence genes